MGGGGGGGGGGGDGGGGGGGLARTKWQLTYIFIEEEQVW